MQCDLHLLDMIYSLSSPWLTISYLESARKCFITMKSKNTPKIFYVIIFCFIKNNSTKMSVMNKITALLVKYVNVNCLNNNSKNMHA